MHSSDAAFQYFSSSFEAVSHEYEELPPWIKDVMPFLCDEETAIPLDLSPITPGLVKFFLKKRSSNSSPGDDKITYHVLKQLPSCQHFMATLFSNVLQSTHLPPRTWCTARLVPIHKKGDLAKSEKFFPIALTSAVGKLFHSILSACLEQYIIDNGVIDPSLQKGFLRGINGCVEHIFTIQQIFSNAKEHSLPFPLALFT